MSEKVTFEEVTIAAPSVECCLLDTSGDTSAARSVSVGGQAWLPHHHLLGEGRTYQCQLQVYRVGG